MPKTDLAKTPDRTVPAISPFMWRWFSWYARRFLRKHFHAVRVLRNGGFPELTNDEPLIVYVNHPSWWDPMIGIFLASYLTPTRKHYWPIDSAMLAKYRFFAKLGFFGVEQDSARGAATFLRTATRVLTNGSSSLWITAQGEFADVRARPIRLRPGLAHVARRLEKGVIVPLAGEYVFWTERTPEVLLNFGKPIRIADHPSLSASAWQELLETRLTITMDGLAPSVIARDPAAFNTLLIGATGTSRAYDLWRRAHSAARGKAFDASHMPRLTAPQKELRKKTGNKAETA